ncbi:MAG TPA: ATP-binding cassette domain-containing protein [Propionibacterium sp.]|jgi:D-methionine transport system ATP-binding protein|nr:ATP-binding cassette domain-containing protein [Propionibacterium sp.]
MADPIITFDGVHKTFGDGPEEVHAVIDVSFAIQPGEIFGVIGFSGAGKSTVVRLINGLERSTSGRITVDGFEISAMSEGRLRSVRPDIGMIFQQFNLFSSKTIAENVAYPLRLAKWDRVRRRARVAELLEFVGLSDKISAYPAQLSGGQKQRVGIARALATGPKILLADESTSALDPQTTHEVLELLRRVNQELGLTIVLITHEMDVVRHLCDRVAIMERGRVVELGSVYDVFASPKQDVTRRFVQTALRDRPSPDALARLAHAHPGRLVTVPVVVDPIIAGERSSVFARHGINAQVVYGGIIEISERPYGSLTYALTGDDAAIDRALAELVANGGVEEHDRGLR